MNKFSKTQNMHFTKQLSFLGAFLLVILTINACTPSVPNLKINNSVKDQPVQHALKQLEKAELQGKIKLVGNKANYTITTRIDNENYEAESFEIKRDKQQILVTAGDAVGLMYGLLDIKEQLETGDHGIKENKTSPHLPFRALKFNLPWDSYRNGKALDLHYETCRDTMFWHDFLDMMAENRFNKLTLWNLHPFNYLVKTEKYPEACGFSDEEMQEWEKFWHTLFRMAKDRGIETYLVNWNIFVSPEFAEAHGVADYCLDHEYKTDQGDTSEIIKDYMRECVRETINNYPDLTGLGITLGEAMGGMTAEEREEWLLETVIEGSRMADRKIKFIHRVPLSADKGSGGSTSARVERMTRETLDTLTCFQTPINIELKFNWSHGHSTPDLVKVHGGKLTDAYWNPPPTNYKLAWMIRNEDFFMLRWGQSDFIREHIRENVHPFVNGYYVGSETYIPAKNYITSVKGTSYHYAFERQWMFYKAWGKLLYNPDTPDSYFAQAYEQRYPGHGSTLLKAQLKASRIPLIIASWLNARWDFTLYSEGMLGFNDDGEPAVELLSLETMCRKNPMDPSYIGIKGFLDNQGTTDENKITPIELSDSIESFCSKALKETENIVPGENMDLMVEVSDVQAWSHLGLYFANKLRAAVEYQKYLNTRETQNLRKSIEWLEKAVGNWNDLVTVTSQVYDPVPLMHYTYRRDDEYFHWSKVKAEVDKELEWLKNIETENLN